MDNPVSSRRRSFIAAIAMAAAFFTGGAVAAEDVASYPSKPIRIIVGFAPGGGSDFIARVIAKKLSDILKQPVIVDNKPGAGGNLGAEQALKSAPDGYTLFLAAASYTVNPAIYTLNFNSVNDMTPVAQLARGPFIITVNPKTGINSLKEMVDRAKKEPGKLFYASAGNGSITHMASEHFMETAGITIQHVPYKGTSPALTDTIAGQTQIVFGTPASTLPFVKSGQLKALAVTTPKRLPALPNVPTVMESGYADFQVTNWHGLIGPKGIPAPIVAKLNKAINDALHGPGMEKELESDGLVAAGGSAEEFGALIRSEVDRWGKLAKAKGIKAD